MHAEDGDRSEADDDDNYDADYEFEFENCGGDGLSHIYLNSFRPPGSRECCLSPTWRMSVPLQGYEFTSLAVDRFARRPWTYCSILVGRVEDIRRIREL